MNEERARYYAERFGKWERDHDELERFFQSSIQFPKPFYIISLIFILATIFLIVLFALDHTIVKALLTIVAAATAYSFFQIGRDKNEKNKETLYNYNVRAAQLQKTVDNLQRYVAEEQEAELKQSTAEVADMVWDLIKDDPRVRAALEKEEKGTFLGSTDD